MSDITLPDTTLEKIVRDAVRQEIEPLERRVSAVETKIETAVTVPGAQKMIDASVDNIHDRLREISANLRSIDLHLRQAEKAAQTVEIVNERLSNTSKLLDRLEDRVRGTEDRVSAVEDTAREQRIALFGDPTLKDDRPSLTRIIQDIPAQIQASHDAAITRLQLTFDMAFAANNKMLDEIRVRVNDHTEFIEQRRSIEQKIIQGWQFIFQSKKWPAVITGAGTGLALLVKLIEVLGAAQ